MALEAGLSQSFDMMPTLILMPEMKQMSHDIHYCTVDKLISWNITVRQYTFLTAAQPAIVN